MRKSWYHAHAESNTSWNVISCVYLFILFGIIPEYWIWIFKIVQLLSKKTKNKGLLCHNKISLKPGPTVDPD